MPDEKELKEWADKIYAVGFKNGQLEMKNKVMKLINRDFAIVGIRNPVDVAIHFLKKINRIRLSTPLSEEVSEEKI